MTQQAITRKIQRLGSAIQMLTSEFQELQRELEVSPPVRQRRDLKTSRKDKFRAMLLKPSRS